METLGLSRLGRFYLASTRYVRIGQRQSAGKTSTTLGGWAAMRSLVHWQSKAVFNSAVSDSQSMPRAWSHSWKSVGSLITRTAWAFGVFAFWVRVAACWQGADVAGGTCPLRTHSLAIEGVCPLVIWRHSPRRFRHC